MTWRLPTLRRLRPPPGRADGEKAIGHPADRQAVEEPAALLAVLDTIEQLRRLRDLYAHHSLDDVEWDLLLELLRAERLQQRMSVSALMIVASGASTTTSLRRINQLRSPRLHRTDSGCERCATRLCLADFEVETICSPTTWRGANAHLRDLPP